MKHSESHANVSPKVLDFTCETRFAVVNGRADVTARFRNRAGFAYMTAMRAPRIACFALAIAAATLAAPAAKADVTKEARAAATTLFDDGRKLTAANKYAEACPKFEEAMKLDPGIGIGFNLADCWEHTGRLASAWIQFRDTASLALAANQPDREKEIKKRVAALEPRLTRLTIVVPEGARAEGLVVQRDGSEVGKALWGSAIPVDAGKHRVSAAAPGRQIWETSLAVEGEGKTLSVEVPVLPEKKGGDVIAPPPPSGSATGSGAPPPPPAERDAPRSWQKPLGFVALGVGAVGVGVSVALGFAAKSKKDDSNADGHCVGNTCDDAGTELRNSAVSLGNVGTGVFIAGAVVAAGGLLLVITAPSSKTTVGLGPSSVAVRGVF